MDVYPRLILGYGDFKKHQNNQLERRRKMKFLDLFAGIGGFRLGMEQVGHECVGFCEIDKFARASYKAIHNTDGEVEMHDITTVSDEFIRGIESVDVICGGFPCQAFSIAGKRKGFKDTRGTLFFEIARFASILRPRYLFLENVKGLLNHEGGATFETILRALDELGYDVEWQVLNSKDYVPQNRERVFIIGHLRGERTRKIFPFSGNDEQINPKYRIKKIGNIRKKGLSQSGDVVSIEGIAPTMCSTTTQKDPTKIVVPALTPDRIEKRQNGRRFKENGDEMFTLNAHKSDAGIYDGFQIRKLTPRECWRLQGFPDWAFDRAKEVNSDSQLYKQAGNSVTVPVIHDIARRLVSYPTK